MNIIPVSADTYYDAKWSDWLCSHLGSSGINSWGFIVRPDGSAEHYVDVFIKDPSIAIMVRLSTGI